jgi:hypothetical protein
VSIRQVVKDSAARVCSEPDCCDSQRLYARGLCKRHYMRKWKAGTLPPIPKTPEERFWKYVQRGEPDDCWIWTASTDRYGYGQFKMDGKMVKAHRFSYTLAHGPIPDGLHVLHHCDNPPCVNPAHLFPGSHIDNMRDREAKGRGTRGTANGRCRLTDEEVAEIRNAVGLQREIAERFGISHKTVGNIKRGKTHRL